MYISDIAHRFDLLFKDLAISSPARDTTKQPSPDDQWAHVVLKQLNELHTFLNKELPELEKTHALSTLHTASNAIENITLSANKYLKSRSSKKRISEGVVNQLRDAISKCRLSNESFRSKLGAHKISLQQQPQGVGAIYTGVTKAVGVATGLAQKAFVDPNSPEFSDEAIKKLRLSLYLKSSDTPENRSTAPAMMAHYLGKFVTNLLREELIESTTRDPLLRAPFLKDLLYDPNAREPTPRPLGSALVSLLQNNQQLLEKIIEVNMLRCIENIYSHLEIVEQEKPQLLGDVVLHCFKVGDTQLSETKRVEEMQDTYSIGTAERTALVSTTTPKNLADMVLKLGWPNGTQDLQLPQLPFWNNEIKQELFNLANESLTTCFYTAFKEMAENNNLKEALLLQGFRAVKQSIGSQDATQRPPHPLDLLSNPQRPAFATAGIIFIFFQVLFSTIGDAIRTAWRTILFQPAKPTKSLSPAEQELNDQLHKLASEIIQESPSGILRILFYFKGRAIIDKLGPQILEKLHTIKPHQLFTNQLESLLTNLLAPGGTWKGEGEERFYYGEPPTPPKTVEEKLVRDQNQQKEVEELHKVAKKTRDSLGEDIQGLVRMISGQLHLSPRFIPSLSPSAVEQILASAEAGFIRFANNCIDKLVSLSTYIIGMESVITKTGKEIYYKTRAIQQDSFLLAVSQFAKNALEKNSTAIDRPNEPRSLTTRDQ